MDTIRSVSVQDALEQLQYPSFFDSHERRDAYYHIMLWGSPEEKAIVQEAREKHPFDEHDTFHYISDEHFQHQDVKKV